VSDDARSQALAAVPVVPAPAQDAAHSGSSLGRRNDKLLLGAIAAYAVVLSVLMISRGISVTPDVVVVAFGLAAVLLGRGRLFLRDWIPFVALFFAYELMRGYADKFGLPIHVADVISAERIVGLGGLPTVWLQGLLHSGPAMSPDNLATISVVFYFLHFPLPLAIGFLLWIHHRRDYYDYVAALIVLSMAAFVTYLILPVAPPWWADKYGYASGILHLRDNGFQGLSSLFGFGQYLYSYSVYSISSNDVAAFPSLHAAYPFLAFLFARRCFGRAGWLMLAYTLCIWFAIVYLGEHWVVDIIGGVIGAAGSGLYLVPWLGILGGLWRAAAGLVSR
jgi:membrane-associated phospholipid phosphatase